ncbi:amidohydrolase family protein [Persicitalea jodogahamensis]|uniref:Amidohydrolase n=1 Tax=Persicitalea jodogahamensis TaxID=402147 RepID=A0A8J3D834_9BACT|nr:amidohydrolase family protein [Persicitalea jodogahamensis]GHB67020.1 amidohydrolase [Persicitalea jodogahamensis]
MQLPTLRLIILALFFLPNHKANAQTAQTKTIPVTLTEGTNLATALSPDKSTLVLDLQGTLWLLPVEGGEARAITDALGDCRQPVWSPDGRRIAFQSYRDGNFHIWSVGKDGSDLRQLTFGIYHDREPDWSPDGQRIAFSSDRSGNYDVWEMELATGKLTQRTTNPASDYFPAYAPDGSKLAFVSERKAGSGLYALDADGKEQLIVACKEKLFSPVWHPDGNRLVVNSQAPGQSSLELVNIGGEVGGTLSKADEDVFPFKLSWLSAQEYIYTSDGQIKRGKLGEKGVDVIPFRATVTLKRAIYPSKIRDFDAKTERPVQGIRSPVVSPDGQQIAFTALSDLWICTKGQPKPQAITNDAFLEVDPVWSPDGKKLAYTSDRNGNMDLWVMDLVTKKESCVYRATETLMYPSWSPDGKQLAFFEADPKAYSRSRLSVLDFESGQAEPLYGSLFAASQPSWSPDGKYLYISAVDSYSDRFREGLNKILVVPVDKSPSRFLSPVAGRTLGTRGKNGPLVSPDGTKIAYVLDNLLWTIDIDQSGNFLTPPRCLTTELAESPSWTGDSQSLVYLATDELKQVFLTDGHTETIDLNFTWKIKQPTGQLVIHAGKIFDGRSEKYLENQDIVIEGNRIKQIVPHQNGRSGRVIDASKQVVLPGLFEMHTHQNAQLGEPSGRLWLSYGITSIREPGTDPYDALERKEAWASGARLGPRTFFTGGHMEGPRVYYNRNTSNVGGAQLELELNRADKLGYDMIKTYVGLPDILQKRVTEFAHAHGIPVSSHEIYPAAGYGVDAVEHMGATSRRGYSPKLTALDHSYQDVIQLIAKSGMYITPTASLHGGLFSLITTDSSFFDHWQFSAFYPEKLRADLKATAVRRTSGPETYSNVEKTLVALMRAGARMTPGTDSPITPPGLSYHAELQSWVAAGLSPFETLRSATSWAAEEVGVGKDVGTVEAGKLADLVIVDGDPLQHIQDMLNVKTVIRNGEVLDRESLTKPNR